MATSRGKAEGFRKGLDKAVAELLTQYNIPKEDVTVTATITVLDQVRYSSSTENDTED